jgi:glycosyltransferase involved in cell wall biosynthesis
MRVLPWGVDRALFQSQGVREPGLVLSTRMHEDVYDLPLVIRAMVRVLADHPHATLVVAGAGSRTAELEALASRLLPAGRWRFVGRLSPAGMASWLARAEVVVSASRSDSTSQSLLEAMAAGAVPVVSDIAGNREWVAEGEGARLFPCGDAAALSSAVGRVLAESEWAALARARNAQVVAERGDWDANLARIEAWFERLAAREPLGSGGAA